jgi:hypothetical protein
MYKIITAILLLVSSCAFANYPYYINVNEGDHKLNNGDTLCARIIAPNNMKYMPIHLDEMTPDYPIDRNALWIDADITLDAFIDNEEIILTHMRINNNKKIIAEQTSQIQEVFKKAQQYQQKEDVLICLRIDTAYTQHNGIRRPDGVVSMGFYFDASKTVPVPPIDNIITPPVPPQKR